ncbi:MAG: metallophosphoesterase [Lachnospiraceae bacterium]|nr:metallophosphoesterase [Lachnospiraceae bacterium]
MTALYVIVSVLALLGIYSFIETKLLKTTFYTAGSSRIPKELDGKRIVLLSDLHNTYFGNDNSKLMNLVVDARPDMIIIAGDLINGRSSRKQFGYAYQVLEQLSEMKVPVYYSFGNHEYRVDGAFNNEGPFREYLDNCTKRSIVLNNASCGLENREAVDDTNHDQKVRETRIYGLNLPKAQFDMKVSAGLIKPVSYYVGEADRDNYNILIAHDPSYFEDYMKWGADLVLSGHVHGGVIRLPFIGGLLSPRYTFFPKIDKGIFRSGEGTMVASGGIGWHNLPFRFMNRPEVVIIDLKKNK